MAPIAWIAGMVVLTVLCAEGIRRIPPKLGVALCIAVPVLATPAWMALGGAPLFSVVKVYSVCVALVYLELLRATRWAERPWARVVAFGLLAVNILEAVAADALQTSVLNAVTGVLLVLTQAPPRAVSVDVASPQRDLRYALGGWWVAAYSLWNFAFVYGNRPGFAAFAIVHVGAPLIACRGRSELWLQARVTILTLMMILRMSAPEPPFVYLVPEWQSPAVGTALYVAAFALTLVVVWRRFVRR